METLTSPQKQFPNNSLYNINKINVINKNDEDSLGNFKSELEKKNTTKDTKSTSNKNNEDSCEPQLYTSNDILNIFNNEQNKDIFTENIKKLKFSEYIEDDLNLTKKKRIRPLDYDVLILNNNLKNDEGKIKRGRKGKENNQKETHDKRCPDNIIKKVKVFIFKCALLFLNKIINENFKYKIELMKLDYKFVNRIEKEQDLKILNMRLKDLFSNDISPKYTHKFPKDYNKKIIERILKDADDMILFAFNMTLGDWLDIFTLKKSVKDIINVYNNKNNDCQNLIEKIEQNLIGLDKIVNKIKENNDEDYMALFIFCLYNYERWFYLRKRKTIKKEKEI